MQKALDDTAALVGPAADAVLDDPPSVPATIGNADQQPLNPRPPGQADGSTTTSLTSPNRDLTFLHPIMRQRAQQVLTDCQGASLPFRIFEAWRSPERQRYLYSQGRTRPGNIVTFARSWESYHQYGLAADFVLYLDGQGGWSWDDAGAKAPIWQKLHEIGRLHGLEPLGFETPHLQIAGLKLGDLKDGNYPDGGDATWQNNMAETIARWNGTPSAPPPFANVQTRPALSLPVLDWTKTPRVGAKEWHSVNGGQEWRHDDNGLYLRDGADTPIRSPGAPLTAQTIVAVYASEIYKASMTHGVPPELIVMTIATESADARDANFTGPRTFRWEAAVQVTDVTPATFGDYSAGPMQTLASTARDIIRKLKLTNYDPLVTAPYLATQPSNAPVQNPLYDGATNLDLGTAEIRSRLKSSGFDPILVAACFNAGGLYPSSQNAWRLRTYGNHLDRASQWFGDACFIFSSLRSR